MSLVEVMKLNGHVQNKKQKLLTNNGSPGEIRCQYHRLTDLILVQERFGHRRPPVIGRYATLELPLSAKRLLAWPWRIQGLDLTGYLAFRPRRQSFSSSIDFSREFCTRTFLNGDRRWDRGWR